MSKVSDLLEQELVTLVEDYIGQRIPYDLPQWLIDEGVRPGAKIVAVDGIGSKSRLNKTDVLIILESSSPIKISAKLANADYFGNWYSHKRFLDEFGFEAFERMTKASTAFANRWAETAIAPFVGVSICFGKRTGLTGQDFTDIFTSRDILTVARGFGVGDSTANCMYIADYVPRTIEELIDCLQEISIETVNEATENFKVAHRPINPITEGTNRGKNVYTRFQPYKRLPEPTVIREPDILFSLGRFVTVEPDGLNHNHILNDLEERYNIIVPRKQK
ncbi:MAG: hypothetical protein J6A53_08680 [Clostridia bacterium]|nr:hypothetical protein [Clostridia bacterium]